MGNLQLFQRRLNVWKFEEYGLIRNTLIVKHKADTPNCGGEADILDACKVIQDNIRLRSGI